MKVYLVQCVCDEEYGNTAVIGVFANKADADAYAAEKQWKFSAWYMEDGEEQDAVTVEEWEVK